MIDFRYHLVSLIAVFLALAVGIVLGAGPLAEPIGDTLTGQVDKLREDRNALSEQLNEVQAQMNADGQMMEQLSSRIFNGVLNGQNIALFVMPGADGDDVSAVSTKIGQAGGHISAQVNLQADFFSTAKKAYREALSAQITQYLDDKTRATNPDSILAAAVGQLVFAGHNEALAGILTVADTPLVQIPTPATAAARAAIVIGPRTKVLAKKQSEDTKATAATEVQPQYTDFARTISSFGGGAVFFGSALEPTDLISVLRSGSNSLSTVDGIGTVAGLLTLPFALSATMNGTYGAWGSGEHTSALLPPITEVPQPTAQPEPQNQNNTGETSNNATSRPAPTASAH